jgi:hypothetical protein
VKAQVEQAGIRLVPSYRGDALIGCGGDRKSPVAARFKGHRQRFAKNAVIVAQDQSHKHSPLRPKDAIRPNIPQLIPWPASQQMVDDKG